ncbi:MAG: protein kinase [Planctomycetes bacterium]|nr:protein kinase [Planctomycetota bacterium]
MKPKAVDQQDLADRHRELIANASQQVEATLAILGSQASSPVVFDDGDMVGYERLREIHRGGQGIVYQAIQKSTGRKVAIKVIKKGSQATEADRVRFELEVKILGQLRHPNIVTIHDSGSAGGHFHGWQQPISPRHASCVRKDLQRRQRRPSAWRDTPRPKTWKHPR